jgi:cell division protease FtsH
MFPKKPKPNMNWFLYAGLGLMALGIYSYVVFNQPQPSTDPLRFHEQVSFAKIQELVDSGSKDITGITFLKEGGQTTPSRVYTDGNQSLWAEIPGTYDYNQLSESATAHHVPKNAKPVIADELHSAPSATGSGAAGGGGLMGSLMWSIFISVIVMVVLNLLLRRFANPNGPAGKHGKINLTRLDENPEKVRFEDVAGIDDELAKIESLVFNIKHPELLSKLGGRIPRGGILKGPPGTGKTFLVRAIGGEANLPILSCSGADFVEMYVGTGGSRVRDAFAQARALRDQLNSWVIMFIDEFDAVGKKRGTGGPGGNDERDQTVGQLLVEIQGSGADNSRILVLVATNQPENLDPALTRSDRLGDFQLEVSAPDRTGRLAILNKKIKTIPAAADVDLGAIADEMSGLTGADIETLIRVRAPEFAKTRLVGTLPKSLMSLPNFRSEDLVVTHTDIWKALEDMLMGTITELKGRRLDPAVKHMIAIHELGHFVIAYRKYLQNTSSWDAQYGDAVSTISILGPSGVGGFVRTVPAHQFKTARNLKSMIAIALGGNRSERLFLKETTGGCEGDLETATRIIKAMLLKINMSHCNNQGLTLPAISVEYQGGSRYLGGQGAHAAQYGMSEFSASQVDRMIALFLDEAQAEADAYLQEEADFIKHMAPILVQAERMRLPEIKAHWDRFHEGKDLTSPSSVPFPYAWDDRHVGLSILQLEEPYRPHGHSM